MTPAARRALAERICDAVADAGGTHGATYTEALRPYVDRFNARVQEAVRKVLPDAYNALFGELLQDGGAPGDGALRARVFALCLHGDPRGISGDPPEPYNGRVRARLDPLPAGMDRHERQRLIREAYVDEVEALLRDGGA
jgi:hypothetical protein